MIPAVTAGAQVIRMVPGSSLLGLGVGALALLGANQASNELVKGMKESGDNPAQRIALHAVGLGIVGTVASFTGVAAALKLNPGILRSGVMAGSAGAILGAFGAGNRLPSPLPDIPFAPWPA